MSDLDVFLSLDKNNEFGVKYKNASTPLTLIKSKDGYLIHGFYDRNDESITGLVGAFVFDKAKGEVSHFSPEEDYCAIHVSKEEVSGILKDSKYYLC